MLLVDELRAGLNVSTGTSTHGLRCSLQLKTNGKLVQKCPRSGVELQRLFWMGVYIVSILQKFLFDNTSILALGYTEFSFGDHDYYMIGGSKRTGEGTSPLSTVERYSPSEGKWVTVASMKSQRMFCAAAALNGRIYVCGGSNIYETLNTVECYDPKKNVWVSVAPMKVGRYAFSVVACDNAIYAIAGRNSSTVLCSTEIYNEDTNEWEFDANLTRGRAHFGAAVVPVSPGSLSV
ncbi:kelch repeat protein [Necator americanus]|uniref:Kelch repeat protein n=1 Tax=Necator americanus TaxID=51031 RepID=W2SQJ4_NECAM|nr:kelch repeat protein [Necator americanus]ETN71146.1 kelch repeat protein [Necator americanus]